MQVRFRDHQIHEKEGVQVHRFPRFFVSHGRKIEAGFPSGTEHILLFIMNKNPPVATDPRLLTFRDENCNLVLYEIFIYYAFGLSLTHREGVPIGCPGD